MGATFVPHITSPAPIVPAESLSASLCFGLEMRRWLALNLRLRRFEQDFAVDFDFYLALVFAYSVEIYLYAESGLVGSSYESVGISENTGGGG